MNIKFFLLLLPVLSLHGECIDKQEEYTLLPLWKNGRHYYQDLAVSLNKSKTFTLDELKNAMSPKGESDISYLLHAIAHNEVGNCAEMERYALKIKNQNKLFEISPELGLALADMWLRLGRFEEVIEMLPKEKTLKLGTEVHQRANYYVAISKYLLGRPDGSEMEVAKNRYKKAREIYKRRHPSDALYYL